MRRSMHRHSAGVSRSPLMVEHKPMVDALDVVIGRVVEPSVRHIHRPLKQCVTDFFAHVRIVRNGQGRGYSHFPIVTFVHAFTLSLGNANKNVRGVTA